MVLPYAHGGVFNYFKPLPVAYKYLPSSRQACESYEYLGFQSHSAKKIRNFPDVRVL
jgi:hypothetical protein